MSYGHIVKNLTSTKGICGLCRNKTKTVLCLFVAVCVLCRQGDKEDATWFPSNGRRCGMKTRLAGGE